VGKKISEIGICAGCKEERPLVLLVPAWGVLCEECAATPEDEERVSPTPEQQEIARLRGALDEIAGLAGRAIDEGAVLQRIQRLAAAALGEEEG
jgi:hypothetical protein